MMRLGSWVQVSLLLPVSAGLQFLPIFQWKLPHSPDHGELLTEKRQLDLLRWKADSGKCWTCNIHIWVPLSAMFTHVA